MKKHSESNLLDNTQPGAEPGRWSHKFNWCPIHPNVFAFLLGLSGPAKQ